MPFHTFIFSSDDEDLLYVEVTVHTLKTGSLEGDRQRTQSKTWLAGQMPMGNNSLEMNLVNRPVVPE